MSVALAVSLSTPSINDFVRNPETFSLGNITENIVGTSACIKCTFFGSLNTSNARRHILTNSLKTSLFMDHERNFMFERYILVNVDSVRSNFVTEFFGYRE
mmetsp:Transcript_34447/g.55422  ORF Transcript_34447/g.55422 Transcript_34447/m.55422 type:complete len:101 (-) Transcript_34447:1675-1977(-)